MLFSTGLTPLHCLPAFVKTFEFSNFSIRATYLRITLKPDVSRQGCFSTTLLHGIKPCFSSPKYSLYGIPTAGRVAESHLHSVDPVTHLWSRSSVPSYGTTTYAWEHIHNIRGADVLNSAQIFLFSTHKHHPTEMIYSCLENNKSFRSFSSHN